MAESTEEPILQQCEACGSLVDVSDLEPLAIAHCPTCGGVMRVRPIFAQFRLLSVLGAGGMGTVYHALDTTLNRPVALKLLRREHMANPEIVAQFEQEARAAASITHPNVVKVYSTGFDHGVFFIAMELVNEGSLDDLMGAQGRVAEAQVLEVGIHAAQGLNAAYKRGLLHRDVKPANILFGKGHVAKISDFGLAALAEHATHIAGEVWGTPYYVAPEKLETPPEEDFRSDMYSLGSTLFHAVAGRAPYEANDSNIVALKHLKSRPVSLQSFAPDVSSTTAFVINKMIAKNPANRYQTYDELVQHLQFAKSELLASKRGKPVAKPRLVLEDAASEAAKGWLTFTMIACMVAIGVFVYLFRDKIWQRPEKPYEFAATPAPAADIEEEYRMARLRLLEGDAGAARDAAKSFRVIDTPGVRQPLRNWVTFHAGLAHLLAGEGPAGTERFAAIAGRGPISSDPTEAKMGEFFSQCAKVVTGNAPIPIEAGKDFNRGNFEAIGLFTYGLKNWSLGKFDEGLAYFKEFETVTPQGSDAWVADFKQLAGMYVSDFEELRSAKETFDRAKDAPDQKKDALAAIQATRSRLRRTESLAELKKLEDQLAAGVAAFEAEQQKMMAAQEAADATLVAELRTKADALAQQMKFTEAFQAVATQTVKSEKYQGEMKALQKRMEYLAKFKLTMISDLSTLGFRGGVGQRSGKTVPGEAKRATDAGVEVLGPFGATSIPWLELSPDWLMTAGKVFVDATARLDLKSDRQFFLGVYALFLKRDAEAKDWMNKAGEAKYEYKDAANLILTNGAMPSL